MSSQSAVHPITDTGSIRSIIPLRQPMPAVLSLGAFLKVTLCVIEGEQAYLSESVGNLETASALRRLEHLVDDLIGRAGLRPAAIAHDLHPDFPTTRLAGHLAQQFGILRVPVQHHHAHGAALAAEHWIRPDEPILSLALDGFGLGTDGGSWGGELMQLYGAGMTRLGHLRLLPLPGGDAAARAPWRMAAGVLHLLGRGEEIPRRFPGQRLAPAMAQLLASGITLRHTSSAGRLFDTACGLLGLHPEVAFEGQAPMALENMTTGLRVLPDGWELRDGVLDLMPLLAALADLGLQVEGEPENSRLVHQGADLFHGTLINALAAWVEWAVDETGVKTVAFSGGCFLNRVLTGGLVERFQEKGLRILIARKISPGDAGLSLGQAWVAAHHLM